MLRQKVARLPDKSGVYLFKNKDGRVIYVGKATSLRSRVRSYFQGTHTDSPKTETLVANIRDLDFIITRDPLDALMLENTLIKKHEPRYNVRLKDDKSYPYLKLTNEAYPRLTITRRVTDDGGKYFGPYSSTAGLRETLRFLQRVFPLRLCADMKKQPCMYFHIGKCGGPCCGEVSEEEYARNVRAATLFLEGRDSGMVERLREEMNDAAKKMQFERASVLRDRIGALESVAAERQKVVGTKGGDRDILGVAVGTGMAAVELLTVRDGTLTGHDTFILRTGGEETDREVTGAFLNLHYGRAMHIPPEIVMEALPEEREETTKLLTAKRGGKVKLSAPSRGANKPLLEMARTNAAHRQADEERKELADNRRNAELSGALGKRLGMKRAPRRIIGMDVSTIQGTSTVGCVVTFKDGAPDKKGYRKFIIRGVTHDDYGALREMARRYFARRAQGLEEAADLVLVDGGKGQISAVAQGMEESGVGDRPVVIGIAKEKRISYILGQETAVIYRQDEPAYMLIRRVDEEAHRFAITFHRKKRGERMFQ